MRNVYAAIALILLVSCDNNNDDPTGSQYIIINQVDGKGNISLYDHVTKTFTENFFVLDPSSGNKITAAKKNGNYLFGTSGFFASKLMKIDLATGTQVKQVDSWAYMQPYIDFHQNNVIMSYCDFDVNGNRSCVKIYDENLLLKDSITEDNVFEMYATNVSNNRLFCSTIATVHGNFFIRVLDLNTNTYIKTIGLADRCHHLIPLSETQLLCVQSRRLFILDTQSLEITKTIETNFDKTHVAFDAASNDLYFLQPNAQPAAYEYRLYKFNLATEEASPVTEYKEGIYYPIIFDDQAHVIVSGSTLKIFSKEGKVLDEVTYPAKSSHIFVK